jgi:diguanylate cyclase (GGDEF)-like protein/PAS domain S-box-containing protein
MDDAMELTPKSELSGFSVDNGGASAELNFLQALVASSDQALLVVAKDGTVRYATPGVEKTFGMCADELVGQEANVFLHPEDRGKVRREIARMVESKVLRSHVTVRIPKPEGLRFVFVEMMNQFANRDLNGFVLIAHDVTETLITAKELQQAKSTESLIANVSWRFANSSVDDTERDLHLSLEELCAATNVERVVLWSLDDSGRHFVVLDQQHASHLPSLDGQLPEIDMNLLRQQAPRLLEGEWVHADHEVGNLPLLRAFDVAGEPDVQTVTMVPMRVAGKLIGFLSLSGGESLSGVTVEVSTFINTLSSIFANAINRRTAERALAFQALHDPLTGLPNRSLLLDRLSLALARSIRSGENVSVMLIDLDGFKDVNDTLGHAAGDELLKVVAQRLQQTLRDADSISRLGGDEFVIVAETSAEELNARTVAGRIVEVLREPIALGQSEVVVSGSVGLVVGNASLDPSLDAGTLLRKADIAMYRAKTAGRDRVEVFSDEMEDRIRKRFELLDDLRRAVNEGELIAWYQPIIDVASGRLTSFEALVRWIHPVRGVISPLDFVELAEGSGVIHELGASVLNQAVSQLAGWRAIGNVDDHVTMSVNVSVRQLLSFSFVDLVEATLLRHGLPATLLHLELTESIFADRHAVTGPLLKLRDLGVRVSIDDFGTGYSSLSYLRDLPINTLKIDRSFVQGLGSDRRDNALVSAVVGMAIELGLEVVAEGVETQEQLDQLERLGCSQAQGYLFGRPAPAGEIHMDVDSHQIRS